MPMWNPWRGYKMKAGLVYLGFSTFCQCGTYFIKDGRQYKLQTKDLCAQAREAGIDYKPARE